MIRHSTEHVSTAPESSSCMLYTNPFDVWHCTRCYEACMQLCVRGNPCSQKFPLHSFHGDINTSGSSDLFTVAMDSFSRLFGDFCSLYASSLSDPVLWFHVVFCFMAELLLFPNAYTFRQHHLQLIVLSSRVEISWTDCCKSGILSRYHTWIQWALQNDPFFSQRFLNADCMAKCMILYTFGNGSDWNTWIQ